MKVKLIKLEEHLWTKDKWVEDKDLIEINDNYIPNMGDFFIRENEDDIYKCVARVLYEGIGIKLYVEKVAKI